MHNVSRRSRGGPGGQRPPGVRNVSWILLVAACGSAPVAAPHDDPKPVEQPPPPRPEPGADLDGPVAPPVRGKRIARGAAAPIDFTSDRAPVAVRAPTPPRGGATTFTFADANGGEQRLGWVARIP